MMERKRGGEGEKRGCARRKRRRISNEEMKQNNESEKCKAEKKNDNTRR